jgi:hypothetical protein
MKGAAQPRFAAGFGRRSVAHDPAMIGMVVFGHDQMGSITFTAAAPSGSETCLLAIACPAGCRASRRLSVGKTADVAISQAVVDECENSADDRQVGLGLAAAPGDRRELAPQRLPPWPRATARWRPRAPGASPAW